MTTSVENKLIKVFIDTDVIIDALTLRDNNYQPSRQLWRHVIYGNIKGYISSKQITDIYYIFKKYYRTEQEIRANLSAIVDSFEILPFLKGDVLACLKTEMNDFEDAIICEIAKTNMIPIVVTNNLKHFTNAGLMVLDPEQTLNMFSLNQLLNRYKKTHREDEFFVCLVW